MAEIKNKDNKRKKLNISKNHLCLSLLAGFAIPYSLLACSCFNIFFENATELGFQFWDFAPSFLLYCLGCFAIFTTPLLLTKGVAHRIIYSLFAGLVVCAYAQNLCTTLTFEGLPADGNIAPPSKLQLWINMIIWIVVLLVFVYFGAISKHHRKGRIAISLLLVLTMVMQTAGVIPSAIEYATASKNNSEVTYLSDKNITEMSTKDNVFVFVVDRFDREFLDELLEDDPHALDDFDGFTNYTDNISTYPRTYPAVSSMLTAQECDFSTIRQNYFGEVYKDPAFLNDLKANNYKVNLYIPAYYAYDDASVFDGIADNMATATGYSISSYSFLDYKMFKLGSYFWLPDALKSRNISAASFSDMTVMEGEYTQYAIKNNSDPELYDKIINEGFATQDEQGTFTFLHLRGCHAPFSMNENCEYVPEFTATSLMQTKGIFKLLREYMNEMKKLGIYDDATIIITGDHANLDNRNALVYSEPQLTALLVKEKGQHSTPLKTSSAQVSQDNFLATIVKSADIRTDTDYGKAYSEIPEGENQVRKHFFQLNQPGAGDDENITYEITGDGNNFENWKITNRESIEYK